jgi:hypothetical protein
MGILYLIVIETIDYLGNKNFWIRLFIRFPIKLFFWLWVIYFFYSLKLSLD